MAIKYSIDLLVDSSTDANWRKWVQFIDDTLVLTGGWVNTADTGQMDIATSAHPTLANQKVGYRIYRMNDALQSTAPCFIKVYYGSRIVGAEPGIWLVIGSGSNGSGTITGTLHDDSATTAPTFAVGNNSTTEITRSFGSADSNRATFGMFCNTNTNGFQLLWGIERTVDASGVADGTGFIIMGSSAGSGISRSRYLEAALGVPANQPPAEDGAGFILGANPTNEFLVDTFGSDMIFGVCIPFRGTGQRPGYNWGCVRRNASFNAGLATFDARFRNQTIHYRSLGLAGMNLPGTGRQDGATPCMRYD